MTDQEKMKQSVIFWTTLLAQKEQPEQEPVAWMFEFPDKRVAPKFDSAPHGGNWVPLYTHPPQRKPLTKDMVHQAMLAINTASFGELQPTFEEMKSAIEAAHGIGEKK